LKRKKIPLMKTNASELRPKDGGENSTNE